MSGSQYVAPVIDAAPETRVIERRPGAFSVALWALVGWWGGGVLGFLVQTVVHVWELDVVGTPWLSEAANLWLAGSVWLCSAWATVLMLRLALPRTRGDGRVAWTWIIVWTVMASPSWITPSWWSVVGVLVVSLPLRWIGWEPDGSARPDPLALYGRRAWVLCGGVLLAAFVFGVVGTLT